MRISTILLHPILYLILSCHAIPLTQDSSPSPSPSPSPPPPPTATQPPPLPPLSAHEESSEKDSALIPLNDKNCDIRCVTDALLFRTSLLDFLTHKTHHQPSSLDWTDNGCTDAPDHPAGFNFADSCKRHDFGYRNYARQNRLTEEHRARIDENLKLDLYHECNNQVPKGGHGWKATKCRRIADFYYGVVRALGRGVVNGVTTATTTTTKAERLDDDDHDHDGHDDHDD